MNPVEQLEQVRDDCLELLTWPEISRSDRVELTRTVRRVNNLLRIVEDNS